jgi:hypothetical protein
LNCLATFTSAGCRAAAWDARSGRSERLGRRGPDRARRRRGRRRTQHLPRLIDFFRQGQLPLDRIVSFYPLEEINRAIEDMETGATVKPVLRMN